MLKDQSTCVMRTANKTPMMAQVRVDQVHMVYEVALLSLFTVLINSTVLALLHWPVIDHDTIVIWIAVTWLVIAFRLLLTIKFHRVQPAADDIDFWAAGALAGSILSGVCWGAACYWLFAVDSLPHQVFLAFVVVGMSAGAVVTLSAQKWSAITFVMLSTLPLLYRFSQMSHEFAWPMSLMVALFMLMMIPISNRSYRNIRDMLVEHYERRQALQRDRARNQVLEMVARGASLVEILSAIISGIENENPNMLCSVLLLDEEGKHLLMGAAPSLPDTYSAAIHGVEIGPAVGSCGSAAYTRKRVIVKDIQTHPYWASYRGLAAHAELRACWSEPIVAAAGNLLGTFAIYHRDIHEPNQEELSIIARAAKLTGIAIERNRADEALQMAAMVYQNTSEAMMITDAENNIVAINPAFTRMTGYTLNEVLGKNPQILSSDRQTAAFFQAMWQSLDASGQWQGEIWNRHKDGNEFAEWLTINTIFDDGGGVHRRMSLFHDITDKKKADALILTQATYDALTELPNRRLFIDRLEQGIKTAHREDNHLALLFIDLDRFKEVNDTLGHQVGDKLLIEAASRIKSCVRESDTVARLGGDEFTVILSELNNTNSISRVSQAINEALRKPYKLNDEQAFSSASIGITVYPVDAASAEELLRNADQAMFAAKQSGGNRCNYFTKTMQEAAQQRMHLIRDIHHALAADEFTVHYQPIVDLTTGCIYKAEALLRWLHPEQGYISPATFIPVAEETGAIHEIGNRVFKEAAQWSKRWRMRYNQNFQISVNKSPVQFMAESSSQDDWVQYLKKLGLPGDGIVIEITEGVMLKAVDSINEKLLRFRDAGIQVAVDDFGTGYSSLSYLKRFDIDYLKIDRSFISNLETDASDLALSEAIVVMAHKLGFKVIAEGVENKAQLDILKQIGCDYAQGYYFSKALPAEDLEVMLHEQSSIVVGM